MALRRTVGVFDGVPGHMWVATSLQTWHNAPIVLAAAAHDPSACLIVQRLA
jgi:hypothetical protein